MRIPIILPSLITGIIIYYISRIFLMIFIEDKEKRHTISYIIAIIGGIYFGFVFWEDSF